MNRKNMNLNMNSMSNMNINTQQIEQLRDIVVRQALPISPDSVHSSYSSIQASSHLSTESELTSAGIMVVKDKSNQLVTDLDKEEDGKRNVEIQTEPTNESQWIENESASESELEPIPIPISLPIVEKYTPNTVRDIEVIQPLTNTQGIQNVITPEERGFDRVGVGGVGVGNEMGNPGTNHPNMDVNRNTNTNTNTNGVMDDENRDNHETDENINVLGGNNDVDVGIRPDVKTHDVVIQICSCSLHCCS
jgi:hypothetical protein